METILIIADQMDNCRLFAEELAFDGYTVILIGHPVNIQEEVNLSPPDLILIDLSMKGEERWGLLREIKARNPHLPMLMVTAFEKNLGQPLTPAEGKKGPRQARFRLSTSQGQWFHPPSGRNLGPPLGGKALRVLRIRWHGSRHPGTLIYGNKRKRQPGFNSPLNPGKI
jgi:CheY-like chemotaxis protein